MSSRAFPLLSLVALLVAEAFLFSCTPVQANPGTVIETYVIGASKDDAWSKVDDVKWLNASYHLSESDMRAGCRWSIDIPKGATIEHAYYICRAKASSSGAAQCRIQVFDQDSCDDFDVIFWDWAVMSEAVDWTLPNFIEDVWYTSPDLKEIVQAYIDRPGYVSGNYLGLKFVWQVGSQPGHEVWALDGSASSAAKLEVMYTTVIPPIADFAFSPEAPIAGEAITFNASSSYDPDGFIANYTWDFGDDTPIANETDPITTHTYTSTGQYSVTLTVIDDEGYDNSTSDMITVYAHDVAIVSVTPSPTEVDAGRVVNISVMVRNEGSFTETFNVTLYYGNTVIGTQTVTDLEPGTETTLKFSWDTTDVTPDISYTIKAEVSGVSGETDTADNTYTYNAVRVKSEVTSEPFDWGPTLPYLVPILLGALGFSVAGIAWKKREVGQGFEFFNEMTDGGISDAYSVMIIGGAGSGKSLLCQQLAYTYLTQGKSCVYVSYDIFPFEVLQSMKNFGWDISTYELEGTFKFVDSYSGMAGLDSEEKYHVEQPFSLSDLGITMSSAINDVKHKSIRVFLDSTAPLFARVDPSKVTEFLQDRSARIKGDNGAFFFTVGEGTVPSDLMRRLEEVVDCIIELDVYEGKGKTWKRMRVRKLRGRRVADAWITFKIELKKGITFLPPKGWSKSRKS